MNVAFYLFFWAECHIQRLASGSIAERTVRMGRLGAHVTAVLPQAFFNMCISLHIGMVRQSADNRVIQLFIKQLRT